MKLSMNDLLVLSALTDADKYGLEIISDVKDAGSILYLGGLYTILRRLEKAKMIKGYYKEETEDRAGNRRRYYKILSAGDRAVKEARAALMNLWGIKLVQAGVFVSIFEFSTLTFIIMGSAVLMEILIALFSGEEEWQSKTSKNRFTELESFLKKKLFSLRFLLPKKYREEIIGDLIEIKNGLKEEGHGKAWMLTILLGQFLSIAYSMLRFKVGEMYEPKKPESKEEEELEELELEPLGRNPLHPDKVSVPEKVIKGYKGILSSSKPLRK